MYTHKHTYQSNCNSFKLIIAKQTRHSRCRIPQCDTENPIYAPDWILNAVPGTSLTNFENCERYVNSSQLLSSTNVCPAELFDRTQTEPCQDYVYENTLSVVYDVSC